MIDVTRKPIPADVFDALELSGYVFGIGKASFEDREEIETPDGFLGFSRTRVVAPRCMIGHGRFVEGINDRGGEIEEYLREAGITPSFNDQLVCKVLEVIFGRENNTVEEIAFAADARITFEWYVAASGLVRDETMQ